VDKQEQAAANGMTHNGASPVPYQNGDFTPAWGVSQWWLAGRGAVTRGLGGRSLAVANAPRITGGRTQPLHPAHH